MTFYDALEQHAHRVNSLLCVGLDPHVELLPAPTAQAARDFCLRLIEATANLAAAYKPNSAFFEVFGAPGWQVLAEVIHVARQSAPVILDAKRGDIASTAQAYAQAAFVTLGADAITLNPYLGYDALEPFLADPQRGVFLLCHTSNPSAPQLQGLPLHPWSPDAALGQIQTVYEAVARYAATWNRNKNLGLVVSATHPQALQRVRQLAPKMWFLCPGVGVQGGELETAMQNGLREDGWGLLINLSRTLALSSNPREAAQEWLAQMREHQERKRQSVPPPRTVLSGQLAAIAEMLLHTGCVRFGAFTLKSGLQSPIYIDLRQLIAYPQALDLIARAYLPLLHSLTFDRLAALPYAAIPIATAISLLSRWPLIYPRKEAKTYGTQAEIEGVFTPGERVVLVDDLATTGESKFEALARLSAAGLQIRDIVVLIDRQSGAAEALAAQGYRLHSVLTLTELLDYWQSQGQVEQAHLESARRFIQETRPS